MRVNGSFLSVVATTGVLAILVAFGANCQKSQSVKTDTPQSGTSTIMPGTGTAMMNGNTMMNDNTIMSDSSMPSSDSSKYNQTGAATQYYTCTMHPQVHQAKPGQCPICGMNLVFHKADKTAK